MLEKRVSSEQNKGNVVTFTEHGVFLFFNRVNKIKANRDTFQFLVG